MTTWRIPFKRAWDWRSAELSPEAAQKLDRDFEYIEKALNSLQSGGGAPNQASFYTSDAFTRGAPSAITLGSTDAFWGGSALAWSVVGTGTWGISSTVNQLERAWDSGDFATSWKLATVDVGFVNVSVSATLIPKTQNTINGAGICVRFTDISNFYYLTLYVDGAGTGFTWRFGKVVAGVDTFFVTMSSPPAADGVRLKLTVVGSTITAYINDIPFYVATDTNHSVQTKHGLCHKNDGSAGAAGTHLLGVRWDDFWVTAPT